MINKGLNIFKKMNAFWRYFLLAFIITIILLSLILIGSSVTLHTLEKERFQYGQLLLEKTQADIDSHVLRVKETINQISLMSDTMRIFPLSDTSSYTLYEVGKELSQMTNVGELIDNITLFFIDDNIFIQSGVYSYRTSFYDHSLSFEGLDYGRFIDYLRNPPYSPFFSFLSNNQVKTGSKPLTLIQVFPFSPNRRQVAGAVILHLNSDLFFLGIDDSILGDKGIFKVFNDKNELIYSRGDKSTTDNRNNNYLQIESTSKLTHWHLTAQVPANTLMEHVIYFKTILLIMIPLLFLLLILISYFAAKTQASLVNSNRGLEGDIQRNKEILQRGFLPRLTAGKLASEQEIEKFIEYVELDDFRSERYHLILLRIEKIQENYDPETLDLLSREGFSIIRIINRTMNGSYCIQKIQYNLIGILYGDKNDEKEIVLPHEIQKMADSFTENPDFNLSIAVSHPFYRLLNAPLAYIQANITLRNNPNSSEILYFGSKIEISGSVGFYYPIELETHILSLIRIGESTEAIDAMIQILEHNEHLSTRGFHLLKIQIVSTLFKALNLIPGEDTDEELSHDIEALLNKRDRQTLYHPLPSLIDRISQKMNRGQVDADQLLISRTIAYLEENFSDPLLNLDKIADYFEVNKKNLSRLYKRITGENLSRSLEQRRLTKAFTLVIESKRSIEAISKEMGYLNYNTFHKAFKKRFHRTPGSFRTID